MSKARAVFLLWAVTATVAGTLVIGALLVAVTRVAFDSPTLEAFTAACTQWLLPHADPASLAVLAAAALGAVTITAGWRSAARQLRATRRFQRSLRPVRCLPGMPDVSAVDRPVPEAFCVGLLHPRIYVSAPALQALSQAELAAVIAHERHHARRREPLRLLLARTVGDGLFWLPALRRLAERYAALAELAADDAARRATGGRKALASALLAFDAHPSPAAVGIAPQRVASLLGARAGWELPALTLAGAAATLAALGAIAVRLAQTTDHAGLPLPVVLAQLCAVAMALVPVGVGAAILSTVWRAATSVRNG